MKNSSDSDVNCSLEECVAMADLQSNDVKQLINVLKLRTSYYQEETAKMETVFLKLGLMDERLKMFEECKDLVEELSQLQIKFDVKDLTPNALALSYAHNLRKHNNYTAKLKICLKMYIELNETLWKKIKQFKNFYEQAQQKVDNVVSMTMDEVNTMEKKISRYEQELVKLEKKHPWLKNPDYNLPNISKEINLLVAARQLKEELLKELECYGGLKPDLQEANEQLSQIKREYEEVNKKLLEK